MTELFETVMSDSSRRPLAAVTNLPETGSHGKTSGGPAVVAEIRKAVRAFQTRRVSEIPGVGEYWMEEMISDRPTSQVVRCRRLTEDWGYFVVKKRKVSKSSLAEIIGEDAELHALSVASNHKNIIEFMGAELFNDKVLHIYLEYPPKTYITLHEHIHNINENECIRITRGMLDGLSWMHNHGVLHGDCKPSNVLVEINTMQVKLIDFGSAGIAENVPSKLKLISEHTALPGEAEKTTSPNGERKSVFRGMRGTVQYAAPEILGGDEYSYNVDCWSLGCVLCEVVSKEPPFGVFDNVLAATYAILSNKGSSTPMDEIEPSVLNSGWSPLFRNFLRMVLVRDKRRRPDAETLKQHPWIYLPITN